MMRKYTNTVGAMTRKARNHSTITRSEYHGRFSPNSTVFEAATARLRPQRQAAVRVRKESGKAWLRPQTPWFELSERCAKFSRVFGFSFGELLMICMVALIAVGPKKLPGMLHTLGQWLRKIRNLTSEVRSQTGIDELLRSE